MQQQKLKQLFDSLGYVLPCVKCCKHFREFVHKHPPPVGNREQLCRWLVDAHNNANEENRSKYPVRLPPFTYEDAVKQYAYERDVLTDSADKEKRQIQWSVYIVVIVLVVLLVVGCSVGLVFSCSGGRTCPAHRWPKLF